MQQLDFFEHQSPSRSERALLLQQSDELSCMLFIYAKDQTQVSLCGLEKGELKLSVRAAQNFFFFPLDHLIIVSIHFIA